ncbi:MAG: OapA N-terminal domain-containing protein, partial [Aeromonas sp.]
MVIWHAFNALPHWHRKMVLILSILTMMLAIWPSEQRRAPALDENGHPLMANTNSADAKEDDSDLHANINARAKGTRTGSIIKQVKVHKDDNLGLIFQQVGLDSTDLQQI